ncbi:MAG: 4a-hydroxytetrahydrobiopterin dehydratase [Litorivicinaceae bacterium]|jgi:4a-hydroxytetrahydrobiopterin dehydratase
MGWKERKRPPRMERRYQFEDYDALRDFLDAAAEASEACGFYPDMAFGRSHLNVTIHPDEGSDAVSELQREFANTLDAIGGYLEEESN